MLRSIGVAVVVCVFVVGATWRGWADILDVPAEHGTIQLALDAAIAGDTVRVAAGVYVGNLTIGTPLQLISSDGPGSTTINGRITINAANVELSGFTITAPGDTFGVIVGSLGPADGAFITGNAFVDIGMATSGQTQAVWVADGAGVSIFGNTFDGISAGAVGSAKAVQVSQTGGAVVDGLFVSQNIMENISATNGGAYGLIASGPTTNLLVYENLVQGLTGAWGHAISLDDDSQNATIERNIVTNVVGTASWVWRRGEFREQR